MPSWVEFKKHAPGAKRHKDLPPSSCTHNDHRPRLSSASQPASSQEGCCSGIHPVRLLHCAEWLGSFCGRFQAVFEVRCVKCSMSSNKPCERLINWQISSCFWTGSYAALSLLCMEIMIQDLIEAWSASNMHNNISKHATSIGSLYFEFDK